MDFRGTLKNAFFIGGNRVYGKLYDDKTGKYFDGEKVLTSPVIFKSADTLITRNSAYKVESWA
jgi:hypothetical protein